MEFGDASDDDKVMVRKMIITAFWCIQLLPADRPSMSKALRMHENEDELLEMPSKPFHQLPLDTSSEVHGGTSVLCVGVAGVILAIYLLGICCLLALVAYKWRRRHLSADDNIENFLKGQGDLMPITRLRSSNLVAIKLLCKAKADGQDFISEVATIGRIHHVNVAKLIGFCVEGSKQVLVFDFMPNGSLDQIIFAEESKTILSWKKMFDISLSVARGIEYLHQGCDMQILHFDIKPLNILLNENFVPKVSNFGLVKLYSTDASIVSLTAARVGRRKNMKSVVEESSRMYFPSWIYDWYSQGEDIKFEGVTDDEKITVRKMVITAFWCIQIKQTDRPSMRKVLEMLEADVELLRIPPKQFQLPFDISYQVRIKHHLYWILQMKLACAQLM
ncbi:PR5-like receptor kinase [Hibiscus syriacus]|uniref:non-specific serine/threonine protein kinase n=1 Tax=Hibiscus syriacus TaxID=106335 RepID=A0A6A3APM1_HIBSY|nr:PR5-like receptor kinase [Hibiscus syriacus]